MLLALGKPSSNVPFIMPKRVAQTPGSEQIKEYVGSGPFVFKVDEWKPGDKAVYVKFDKYKPRDEPPSGLAGGHVAKVDRVEWISMPEQQTAVNALIAGEIDLIEQPRHDLLPTLAKSKDVKIFDQNPLGNQYALRFNDAAQAVRQPEDPRRAVRGVQPGGLPAGGYRRSEVLQGLQGDVHLRHAARLRRGHEGQARVEHEQGQGDAEGGGLRRHAGRAAAFDRPAGADQPGAGGEVADGAGRLQGRHAVERLADGGGAPRQEGSAVGRRLERDADLLGLGGRPQPGLDLVRERILRQGELRLAVRREDREAARRLRPGNRSGQAEGDRPARCRIVWSTSTRPTCTSASGISRWLTAPTSSGVLEAPAVVLWNIEKK